MEKEITTNKILQVAKLVIILILYIFDVFIVKLILSLYLKNSLSLILSVILASILVIYLSINLFGGLFSKKLPLIFSILSSLIIFGTEFYKISMIALLILVVKTIFLFLIFYYVLKNIYEYFCSKHLRKMKDFDKLMNEVNKFDGKISKYTLRFKIGLTLIFFITIGLYFFTMLPNYIYFRILYPIIIISIIYFSVKFIKNKI